MRRLPDEVAECVDRDPEAGGDENGGVVLLDDGRTLEGEADRKLLALVDGGAPVLAVEEDLALAAGGRRAARSRRQALEPGPRVDPDRGDAHVEDLEIGLLVLVAIDLLIGVVEALAQAGARRVAGIRLVEPDGELEGLADIAHIGGPFEAALDEVEPLRREPGLALGREAVERLAYLGHHRAVA